MNESLILSFFSLDFFIKALITTLVASLIAPPLGVFLILRRMSLLGDALSHGLLPGVALGFYFFGKSPLYLTLGGLIAGLLISFLSVWVHKNTNLQEDTSFAALYLLSLAFGVFLISIKGSSADLIHILFGSPFLISDESFYIQLFFNVSALLLFLFFYQSLFLEIFDSQFYASRGGRVSFTQGLFLTLVVISLVGNFQSHGTLLTMGELLLPAIISRLWFERLPSLLLSSIMISMIGSLSGLLISMIWDLPSGPSSLMVWGGIYIFSIFLNPRQGLIFQWLKLKHYKS